MARDGGRIVPFDLARRKRKNPPAGDAGGHLSNPAGPETPRRDMVRSLRDVKQARLAVRVLINSSGALAEIAIKGGDAFAVAAKIKDALATLYADGFEVMEAIHDAELGDAFDAIFGCTFGDLERALESVGWLIATPETRARIGSSRNLMITRDGVASNG